MSKATIQEQTPYGTFVLFSSSYNQQKKKNISDLHATLYSVVTSRPPKCEDSGRKLLKYMFVGLKGTEIIIRSPVSYSFALTLLCGFTLESRCDLLMKHFPGCP